MYEKEKSATVSSYSSHLIFNYYIHLSTGKYCGPLLLIVVVSGFGVKVFKSISSLSIVCFIECIPSTQFTLIDSFI